MLDQRETIQELRAEFEKLRKANEHLREKLDESERAGKRQAAPFRRSEEKRASSGRSLPAGA